MVAAACFCARRIMHKQLWFSGCSSMLVYKLSAAMRVHVLLSISFAIM